MSDRYLSRGSLPLQPVLTEQPIQVYGDVGVAQPVSVYFATPQPVTIPEPVSVYHATPQADYLSQPAQVYGNVNVFQPVGVYNAPGSTFLVTEVQPQPPFQVYGSAQGVQVYFATSQPVTASLSVPQPLSVYAPSPLPVVAAQPGLQVYGNLGVAQPVSVYLTAGQLTALLPSEPPFQIYGSAQGVQVYFSTPQPVTIPQPVSVYHATPQPAYLSQPAQVYGNVNVFQPIAVYGAVGFPAQPVTVPEPVSVYTDSGRSVAVSVPEPVSVYTDIGRSLKVVGAQPVQVYGSAGLAPVNIYDTQVINDANQVFSGLIGAGSGLNSQIVAPVAGQSLSATLIDVWNVYGAAETVALRFGVSGQLRFIKTLNPNTGFVVNLINSTWRGPTNTGLYIYTWETMGGSFPAAGGFVTYTVMGQYLP